MRACEVVFLYQIAIRELYAMNLSDETALDIMCSWWALANAQLAPLRQEGCVVADATTLARTGYQRQTRIPARNKQEFQMLATRASLCSSDENPEQEQRTRSKNCFVPLLVPEHFGLGAST